MTRLESGGGMTEKWAKFFLKVGKTFPESGEDFA